MQLDLKKLIKYGCWVTPDERLKINRSVSTTLKPLSKTPPSKWTEETIKQVFMAIWVAVFGPEQPVTELTEKIIFSVIDTDTITARTRTRAEKGKVKSVRIGVNLSRFVDLSSTDKCAVYGQSATGPLGFLVEYMKHEFVHMLISTIYSKPLQSKLNFQDVHCVRFAEWSKQLFAHSLPEHAHRRGKIMKFPLTPS